MDDILKKSLIGKVDGQEKRFQNFKQRLMNFQVYLNKSRI